MNIAIWGYKKFGKRTSESMYRFWGDKFCVTKIYDASLAGSHDPWWGIDAEDPGSVNADFENSLFDRIVICVMGREARIQLEKDCEEAGIPVLITGDQADFVCPEDFGAEIIGNECGRQIYRCGNVMVTPASFYEHECVYIFNEDGKVLNDQWVTNEGYDPSLPLMYPFRLKDPVPEKIRVQGSYCLLTKEYSCNYWHFTFQCLIEAYLLEKAGFTGKYIINDKDYNRDIMIMMGISPDRIMTTGSFSVHKIYVFEELFGAQIDIADAGSNARVLAELSSVIRSRLMPDASYPKRIYVKRIGARKLINGDELAERSGFTVFVPDDHSVKEQLNYFYNADIVMCPHGANSTNCLYMRPGSVFIEIFSDRWLRDLNSDVCRENHINHLKAVGKAVCAGQSGMFDDYSISEDRICDLIKKAEAILQSEGNVSGQAAAASGTGKRQ